MYASSEKMYASSEKLVLHAVARACAAMSAVVLPIVANDASAAESIVATNSVFSGAGTWTVAEGDAEIVTGRISATGNFTKYGKGTLALANAGNSFGGTIYVSSGVLRADVEGALGSATVNLSKSSSSSADRSNRLFLNAEGAVFENNVNFTGGTELSVAYSPLHIVKSCEISGNIVLAANKNYVVTDDPDGKPTTVFGGRISGTGTTGVYLAPAGVFSFEGEIAVPSFMTMTATGSSESPGTVQIRSSSNAVATVTIGYANVELHASDAFPDAVVSHNFASYTHAQNDAYGSVTLYADQAISAFAWLGSKYPATSSGASVFSDGAVTLRLKGTTAAPVTYARLCDHITLVKEGDADAVQVFGSATGGRTHTTDGLLVVSNGTLRIAGATTFPNVPEVVVAGGCFDLQSTSAGSLSGVTRLAVEGGTFRVGGSTPYPFADTVDVVELGSSGAVDSESALVVVAGKLIVAGNDAGYGNFTSDDYSDNIGANVTISVPRPEHVYTADSWVGGSSGDSAAAAQNWAKGVMPDLATGDFTPFFAASGSRAVFDSAVSFFGIGFASTNETSFTLAKGGDNAVIRIYGGGLSVAPVYADGVAALCRSYTNEVPVSAQATEWDIDVATNSTLVLVGETAAGGAPAVKKTGAGTLELNGDFAVGGDFTLEKGQMAVRGVFGVEDDSGTLYVKSGTGYMSTLRLENATIRKGFTNQGSGSAVNPYWLVSGAGTTNFVEGSYFSGTSQYFTMESGSMLTLSGGIRIGASFIVSAPNAENATFVIRDNPLVCTVASKGASSLSANVVFDSVGNVLQQSIETPGQGRYLEFRRDHAFATCPTLRLRGGEVRLNSTRQSWHVLDRDWSRPAVTVTGDAGSALEVTLGAEEHELGTHNASCVFAGRASLSMGGTNTLLVTNSVSVSYGDVSVTNGVLRFAADSSWMNGTNVTVCGSGRLEIAGRTFGEQAVLHLEDEGVISIRDGVRQKVSLAYVDGKRLLPGVYSYARTSDESIRRHFDPAVSGVLIVKGSGFVISFR